MPKQPPDDHLAQYRQLRAQVGHACVLALQAQKNLADLTDSLYEAYRMGNEYLLSQGKHTDGEP